jgi:hypothetical protein
MIVLWSVIPAALVCAQFVIAGRGTRAGDKQLIVATLAAAIMVVHVLGVFFNVVVAVVCACLILWVLAALVVGMLAVGAMQMARLVKLTVLKGGLAIPTRVLVAKGMSFKAATIAVVSRPTVASRPATLLVSIPAARVTLLALQEPLELLSVVLFKLMAKLALGSQTKLIVVLSLDQAIANLSKKNTLEVLGKSMQRLVAELAPLWMYSS